MHRSLAIRSHFRCLGDWLDISLARNAGTWGDPPKKPRSGPTPERPFSPSVRLYILRHTSATLPVKRGEATLLEVSRRLGHSDYAFTARIYSHLKAEDTVAVAASFDKRAANVKRLALVS